MAIHGNPASPDVLSGRSPGRSNASSEFTGSPN